MKTLKNNINVRWRKAICAASLMGMASGLGLLAGGCAARKPATTSESDVSSVRVVRETWLDTLAVGIDIPWQSAERTAADSLSLLETDFAVSCAQLLADGSLRHTLTNKHRRLDVAVAVERQRDSVISVVERVVPVEVEVEQELSWWQRLRLSAFWPMLALLALVALALFVGRRR